MPKPRPAFAAKAPKTNMRATRKGACASLRILVALLNFSLDGFFRGGAGSGSAAARAASDPTRAIRSDEMGTRDAEETRARSAAAPGATDASRASRNVAGTRVVVQVDGVAVVAIIARRAGRSAEGRSPSRTRRATCRLLRRGARRSGSPLQKKIRSRAGVDQLERVEHAVSIKLSASAFRVSLIRSMPRGRVSVKI